MGLREQLLKAGLASRKQAKQAQAQARKEEYDAQRDKESAKERQSEKEAQLERIHVEQEEKRAADRRRNQTLEEERAAREALHRCHQLLRSNRLNEPRATTPYHFVETDGAVSFVRKVFVNEYQREMLARGKLAIARASPESLDYAIVPAHTASGIATLHPELVLLRHPPLDDAEELKVE